MSRNEADSPALNSARLLVEAAASAGTFAALAEGVLHTLLSQRLILAGTVEVLGDTPVRCLVGDPTRLPDVREPPSLGRTTRRTQRTASLTAETVSHVNLEPAVAPAASMTLVSEERLSEDLVHTVADLLRLGLDRIALSEQAQSLKRSAERPLRAVSAMYEIGRAITESELEPLLSRITHLAARVMDAQACSLMRVDPDTKSLTIAGSYGISEEIVRVTQQALGEGIAGRVAQSGQPIRISDAKQDPRLLGVNLRADIGSSMVVPMKDEQGQVLGVLCIRRSRTSPEFTEDDLRLFSVFATQAALAMSNKLLYDDLKRRVNQLSTLADLTQAVISHLDLSSVLEHVADNIISVVGFDRCCIYLLDRVSKRYSPRILRGYKPEVIGRNPVKMGEGVVGMVARKQMPIVERDARNAIQPIRGFARAIGASSLLAIPILSKGTVIGVVVADNKLSGRPFHEDTINLLETFANQAGLAIENAQLYEDRDQRYHEMNRLATQTDNILRSIAAAVVVVDQSGMVTRWNNAAEELWGVPEELATRLPYPTLVGHFGLPSDQEARLIGLMRTVQATGSAHLEYRFQAEPHGRPTLYLNVMIAPLIDRQGVRQGAVQVMEDVTRDVLNEQDMARMRRLADIGQLAAKMAHEVRNPLSSIKGAAQLLKTTATDESQVNEFLDIIITEVNSLSRLTTDLLDFARPMHLELQSSLLNDLVERTLRILREEIRESGVNVTFLPDANIGEIECDPRQVEQVLRNLMLNGIQAMPEGGDLTIRTFGSQEPPGVVVQVTDTGPGIPPDRIDDVFQPFFTTKAKGTGLGLAIVRKIVENHGGVVEVLSPPGKGATFTVHFPVRPPSVAPRPEVRYVETEPLQSSLPDR
jgi:PAS domain S-box-containing protein